LSFDHLFTDARLPGREGLVSIGVRQGRFAAIGAALNADAPTSSLGGALVLPGFVDSHIHLDKACLLGRCGHITGGLAGAIKAVSGMKRDFTLEDVYARGKSVIEKAILRGTQVMRSHVEVDPRAGLRSFEALKQLKSDYAFALDLKLCVFPQEGLTNDPGTEELLIEALSKGADLLGGCPYTDTDPAAHVARLFDMAERFDVDLDFHLDFDLDPSWMHLDLVLTETTKRGYQGRVAVGHVTKLSTLPADALARKAEAMAQAGVALTVLPATDLYLMGRNADGNVPRGLTPAHKLRELGVTCSIATNNVLNPFTPFGDGSLLRMANLYANAAHAGPDDFEACLAMVTTDAARLLRLDDYGLEEGKAANFIVTAAESPAMALAGLEEPRSGYVRGMKTFERPAGRLIR